MNVKEREIIWKHGNKHRNLKKKRQQPGYTGCNVIVS